MTYRTKNMTVVFAFASLLLVMPLAGSNAYATEIDAEMGGACGFSLTNLAAMTFGSFIRTDDTTDVGEQEVELDTDSEANASTRVSVTAADWFTIGTRASGTIELADPEFGVDTVTLGVTTYSAVNTGTTGDNFDVTGDSIADAAELASVIRADGIYKASTSGTAIVTVVSDAYGTAQNDEVLSENTAGTDIITKDSGGVTTTNDVDGATDVATLIMDGETTKFDMQVGSSISDTYANKRSIITLESSQEVLGSTDPNSNIFFALAIDPNSATFNTAALPYDGPITQEITVTVESDCSGT